MKILNFGSLNIDYVYTVDHFVKPGETESSDRMETFCGGKGLNQSIALAKAGAQVFHAGKVGKEGEMLKSCLMDNGVDTTFLSVSEGPGGHAVIQVDSSGQNCILLYGGANREITVAEVDVVIRSFGRGDILLLQNETNLGSYIIETAFHQGMRIALNPSPMDQTIRALPLHLVEWLILNEVEGESISGSRNPEDIAVRILEEYPEIRVVLTLGKQGVLYKDKKKEYRQGIYPVEVVDTTAAGDTFTGYFLACVSEGLDYRDALVKASIASALCVSKKGAANSIPSRDEVERFAIRKA